MSAFVVAVEPIGKRSRLLCLCAGCEVVRLGEHRRHQPTHRADAPATSETGAP